MALFAIMTLYVGVGVLAAIGTVTIGRSRFSSRVQQGFISLLLVPVALMYLVFVSYFHAPSALRPEGYAVLGFVTLGILGVRFPVFLILGYALHGAWDLAHEVAVHTSASVGATGSLTAIPLAYGAFCAAYDWCIAGYFSLRLTGARQAAG
jgi:hypothetical protein